MITHELFKTSDLDLAVYLAWRGCQESIPPWSVVMRAGGKKVLEFVFKEVQNEYLSEYRRDDVGIQRYNGLRRHFLRIVHTEIGDAK